MDSSQTWQLAAGNAPAIALTELLLLNDGDRELYKWNLGNGEWCLVEYANCASLQTPRPTLRPCPRAC